MIGKNPYKEEEEAIGFDPKTIGTEAVECLFLTLVATQEPKQVMAFVGENLIIFNNDWFKETEILPIPNQKDRVKTGVVNIMSSDRVIAIKTRPKT